MAKLLGISIAEVQRDRIGTVLDAAKRFNKVVILKGAATIVATPKGKLRVSDWVNHGLSKGGSGDVLAGLIGGLLAQEPTQVYDMASLGVFIHGYAADAARNDVGEAGMRATDVIERLGHFYRDIVQRNQK
jgi:NAD(P)H-hydrate epimerase